MPKSGLLFRFDITGKAVQDGLPSCLLLLDRMGLLTVEGDAHRDARGARREIDLGRAIAERVFDELVLDDLGVGPSEMNPMLPSLASIREENLPPSRRSTEAAVVCQSSDAAFHFLMSSGVV